MRATVLLLASLAIADDRCLSLFRPEALERWHVRAGSPLCRPPADSRTPRFEVDAGRLAVVFAGQARPADFHWRTADSGKAGRLALAVYAPGQAVFLALADSVPPGEYARADGGALDRYSLTLFGVDAADVEVEGGGRLPLSIVYGATLALACLAACAVPPAAAAIAVGLLPVLTSLGVMLCEPVSVVGGLLVGLASCLLAAGLAGLLALASPGPLPLAIAAEGLALALLAAELAADRRVALLAFAFTLLALASHAVNASAARQASLGRHLGLAALSTSLLLAADLWPPSLAYTVRHGQRQYQAAGSVAAFVADVVFAVACLVLAAVQLALACHLNAELQAAPPAAEQLEPALL